VAYFQYLEQSKISLSTKKKGFKPKTGKAHYKIKLKQQDGTQSEVTQSVDLVDGESQFQYTTALVKDGNDFYEVTYTVGFDDRSEEDGADVYTIYIAEVKVAMTLVDAGGNEIVIVPAPKVDYSVVQGKTQKDITANTKEEKTTKLRPLGFEVRPIAPLSFYGNPDTDVDQKTKGRIRKYKVKKTYTCRITSPDNTASIKQYVNEVSTGLGNRLGFDGKGREVCIVIEAEEGTRAAQGDTIFVKLTVVRSPPVLAQNKITAAPPGLVRASCAKDIVYEQSNMVQKGEVLVGAEGAAAVRIDTGIIGGDKFTLEAWTTAGYAGAADDSIELEVWRKAYYQVSKPTHLATPDFATYKASLREVYIEPENITGLNNDGSEKFVKIDPNFGRAGSWHSGLGFASDPAFIVGAHNSKALHQELFRPLQREKLAIHLLCCDAQYDGEDGSKWEPGPITFKNSAPKCIPWPPPGDPAGFNPIDLSAGGAKVPGYAVNSPDGNVFPDSLQYGKPSVSATWQAIGDPKQLALLEITEGVVKQENVVVQYNKTWRARPWKRGRIYIKLPDEAVTALNLTMTQQQKDAVLVGLKGPALVTRTAELDAELSITLKFSAWTNAGPYEGEAHPDSKKWLTIVTSADVAETNDTMVHEFGHGIRMALANGASVPDYPFALTSNTPAKKLTEMRTFHGKHYQKLGDHCGSYNSGTNVATNTSPCVMYGAGDSGHGSHFCAKCKMFVCAMTIIEIR
jgi:hypothetical protein